MNAVLSDEHYISCQSCKSKNSSEATHCSKCKADLLPGRPLFVRFFGGFVGIGIIILVYLSEIPEYFGYCVGILILSGLLMAFTRSPLSERYVNRADRHLSISPSQSVLDYTNALNAPTDNITKCGILIKRAETLMKLGRVSDALSDFQACVDMPKPKDAYWLNFPHLLWKNHTDKAFWRIKEIKRDNQL